MEKELAFIRSSRKYYRSKVTRTFNFIQGNIAILTPEAKHDYREDLLNIQTNLNKYNDEYRDVFKKSECSESDIEAELDVVDDYDGRISSALRLLESSARAADAQSSAVGHAGRAHGVDVAGMLPVSSTLKLPLLPLPEFSNNDHESNDKFILAFETIVGKYNLGPMEKYFYLEKQLKGEPLLLVKSLSGQEQSYDSAKLLLDKAFSSPIRQKFDVIKRMIGLNLPYPGEPYKFVSEFRTVLDEITRLSIDIDTVFQYFVLNGLNDKFSNILMNLTQKTKPTIAEINDKMFSVIERYNFDVKGDCCSVVGLATNVNYSQNVNVKNKPEPNRLKFTKCILCTSNDGDIDHPIFKCPVYKNASSKVDRLKVLGACLKCGIQNHVTKECRFKFKRSCAICNQYHFDYLCLGKAGHKNPTSNSNSRKNDMYSSHVTVNSTFLSTNKSVVLPTFSIETLSGNFLRGMKDTGSQCSFVKEEVAIREQFRVVERNVEINICGFNSSRKSITNIVEVKAKFGKFENNFLAMCLPEISTKLKVPGLSNLARKFDSKGYKLADCFLTNCSDIVQDLDFILGSGAIFCIPDETVIFGDRVKTCFFEYTYWCNASRAYW